MGNAYLTVFIVFSALTLAFCNKPNSKVCDASKKYEATVTNIDLSATVDSSGIIHLKKGSNCTVSFNFKMTSGTAKSITAVVHGIIANVPIPFHLTNPNGCKGSGLTCPISAPNSYDYKSVIPVLSSYPSLRLVVKWQLNDEHSNEIWCMEMPAVIES